MKIIKNISLKQFYIAFILILFFLFVIANFVRLVYDFMGENLWIVPYFQPKQIDFLTSDNFSIVVNVSVTLFAIFLIIGILVRYKYRERELLQQQQLQGFREQQLSLLRTKIECTKQLKIDNKLGKFSIEDLPQSVQQTIKLMTYATSNRDELFLELKNLYPEFTTFFMNHFPRLTELDLIIICLIGLRFSTTDIVQLLWMEPNAYHRRRNLIKQRINLPKDMKIDGFIQQRMLQTASYNRK